MLFKDPTRPAAQTMLAMPTEPEAAAVATAQLIWNLGATGKMVWPIPDRGMEKRLHRVIAPTLIVWGEDEALISSCYAGEIGKRIAGSRVELVSDCGHIPQVEQCETALRLVGDFLDARRMAG